jgi:hypothetical protein
LLAEAVALDRVLERAPLPSLAREAALTERIVTAAQRSPRIVKIGGQAQVQPEAAPVARERASLNLRAAGLLAASLLAGFFIGFSNAPQQIVPAFEAVTGISLGTAGSYNLAQIDPFDEDQL